MVHIKTSKLREAFFSMSLLLLILSLPFGSIKVTTWSIVLLSIAWLVQPLLITRILSLKKNPFFYLFSGLYILFLLGMLYTEDLNKGTYYLEKTSSLIVFPLIFSSSGKHIKKNINPLLFSFSFANIIVGTICLVTNIFKLIESNRPLQNLFHYDIYLSFTETIGIHSVYFSMYISLSISFLIIHLILKFKSTSRLVFILISISIVYLVFLLLVMSSRMQIIILFLVINFICIWISKNKTKALLTAVVLNLVLITVISNMQFTHYQFEKLFSQELSLDTPRQKRGEKRLSRWIASFEIIKENFFIGVGTGDVQNALTTTYKVNGLNYAADKRYNSHNQYLGTFIMLGIFGLGYLVACLLVPFVHSLKNSDYLLASFLLIVGISFLSESMLSRQNGIVFYSLFNSIFVFRNVKYTEP